MCSVVLGQVYALKYGEWGSFHLVVPEILSKTKKSQIGSRKLFRINCLKFENSCDDLIFIMDDL